MRLPIRLEAANSPQRPAYGHGGGDFERRKQDAGLFWWTIFITFLMVMTAGSWIFSLYLFAFPEKPFNYRLLAKLEKLEAIENFSPDTVPAAPSFVARELYEKFYHFSSEQLEGTNGKLKRHYLWNYDDYQPIYVKGKFRIAEVRQLTAADYFTSGLLVQAYPVELVDPESTMATAPGAERTERIFPNAIFELIFPAANLPETAFQVGQEVTLDQSKDFASVLNVSRIDSDHLCFTALPLLYGTYQLGENTSLSLTPPSGVNIEGPWPLSKKLIPRDLSATASGSSPTQQVGNG